MAADPTQQPETPKARRSAKPAQSAPDAAETAPPAEERPVDRAAVLAQAAALLKANGFEVSAVAGSVGATDAPDGMSPDEQFMADMTKLMGDARKAGVQPVKTMVMSYLRLFSEKVEEVAAAIDEGGSKKKADGSKK